MGKPIRPAHNALVACFTVAIAVLAAGCSSSGKGAGTTGTTIAGEVPSIAAKLPANLRDHKTFVVALDTDYLPAEFTSSSGAITGVEADLATAVAKVLGFRAHLVTEPFDAIIPGVQEGKYQMGASSFLDTPAREQAASVIDYLNVGVSLYLRSRSSASQPSISSLCGSSVAVTTGSAAAAEAETQAAACKNAGRSTLKVLGYKTAAAAAAAVSGGHAAAGFDSSLVAGYEVAASHGALRLAGNPSEVQPYGLVVSKARGVGAAVQAAVDHLIADGTYARILKHWGVQSCSVTKAVLDGAAG